MRNVKILLAVVAIVGLAGLADAGVLYETGFETTDGFSSGSTVNGVDGWTVETGEDFTTETTGAISGSMSMTTDLTTGIATAVIGFTNTSNTLVTTECKVKFADVDGWAYLYMRDGAGERFTTVQFEGDAGVIQAHNGSGYVALQDGGSDITYSADTVYGVKVVTDTVAATYDVYIDSGSGYVLGADDWGFRDFNDVSGEVVELRVRTYEAMTVDDVSISGVPEPATMILLGIGGISVLIRRKRR